MNIDRFRIRKIVPFGSVSFVLSISISEKDPTLSPPLSVGCGSGFDSYFGEARLGSHPLSISFHRHGTA